MGVSSSSLLQKGPSTTWGDASEGYELTLEKALADFEKRASNLVKLHSKVVRKDYVQLNFDLTSEKQGEEGQKSIYAVNYPH